MTESAEPTSSWNWLDRVNFEVAYPGEPLVDCPITLPSPFRDLEGAADALSAALVDRGDYRRPREPFLPEELKHLGDPLGVLLVSGPEEFQRLFGPFKRAALRSVRPTDIVELDAFRKDEQVHGYFACLQTAPTTDLDSLVLLIVTGRVQRQLPLRLALDLLVTERERKRELMPWRTGVTVATDSISLPGLQIDESHRLVFGRSGDTVIGEGWREISKPIFPAHSERSYSGPQHGECRALAYDGSRIVRLVEGAVVTGEARCPVVDVRELLDDVQTELLVLHALPDVLADPTRFAQHLGGRSLALPQVTYLILAGIRERFTPWPHPFRLRTPEQSRFSPRASQEQVARLFARFIDAPTASEPPGIAAHFLALIQQGRAPLSTWPNELEGVWGFKIRTGDHQWLAGDIWTEPSVADEPLATTRFSGSSDSCRMEAGAVRCALHYSR